MTRHDAIEALRDADAAVRRVSVPDDVNARVLAALSRSGSPRSYLLLVPAALSALLVVTVLVHGASEPEPTQQEVVLLAQPVSVTLGEGGRVEKSPDGALDLQAGSATFDVMPRAPGAPPLLIRIADARIEVLGTRFVVTRAEQQGHVMLERGIIRLTDGNGAERVLHAPVERTFSLRPAIAPLPPLADGRTPLADQERQSGISQREESVHHSVGDLRARNRNDDHSRTGPVRSAADVEVSLARIGALRAAGENAQALVELERLLSSNLEPRAAETLSFEKGVLLEKLEDKRACAHWRSHALRYANGRYAKAVSRAEARLSCSRP